MCSLCTKLHKTKFKFLSKTYCRAFACVKTRLLESGICVVSRRLLALSIHSTRFVREKMLLNQRVFPYQSDLEIRKMEQNRSANFYILVKD